MKTHGRTFGDHKGDRTRDHKRNIISSQFLSRQLLTPFLLMKLRHACLCCLHIHCEIQFICALIQDMQKEL